MSIEDVGRAVDLGLQHVTQGWLLLAFFGGEPLLELPLMKRALELASTKCAARGVRLFTSVATNGTLLDDERLELLQRYRFQVQVSLDGGAPAQDANRRFANGKSSHAKILKNVKALVEAKLSPWLVSVIDPSNVEHLAGSFDALADLGAPYLNFSPNFLAEWDDAARARFEVALEALADRYLERLRAGQPVRVDPLDGKLATRLAPGAARRSACKFGVGDLAVAPSGRLYPCERLVREDDDAAVCIGDLDHGLDVVRRNKLLEGRDVVDPQCAACELKDRCKRWCGCANYETTHDTARVSPLTCWFERCFIGAADRLGNTLFEEQNPVFLKRFYGAAPAR